MATMMVAAPAQWALERGAKVQDDGAVRFSVWAPKATRAAVRLPAGRGRRHVDVPLEPHGRGVFEGLAPDVAPGTDYKYVLDGERAFPDPVSRWQPQGVHGPSRVVDPSAFRWTDRDWAGPAMPDYVLYELHVGTFSREGTFDGVAAHLAELRRLGVTAVELMPVAEFPGARNWGYDGVHLYAPQSSYGGPEGLRRLVNAAHEAGLAVVLDVVYNHVGPEGNYLGEYGPYFTERYKTPWGLAVNYDDAESDEVRRFVVDNALYWVTEFHVDALRLDAVHGIYDFSARHVLQELAEAVREQGAQLGRAVHVIGESDLNDPRVVRPPARGGWGLDAQWSDDFHHAVHAALTGEQNGYYADFGGVAPVAKALAERFVYDGRYSAHRRRRHGAPAADVPADRFVVCVQNHDQVGNRAAGDRLAALVGVERCKLAAALLLLAPYVPLLFMGEEYGETNPFRYFVSHGDEQLLEAVRRGRREEFATFGWGEDVPDPGAESTFRESTLDRATSALPGHAELLSLYRDLLRVRREERALRPGDGTPSVAYDEAGWITLEVRAPGVARARDLLAVFNLSGRPLEVPTATTRRGGWRLRLATNDPQYGGAGGAPRELPDDPRGEGRITVAPHTALLYRREAE